MANSDPDRRPVVAGSESGPVKGEPVEIKVGIVHASREVSLETDRTADEVAADLAKALANGGLLTLTDTKGRTVLIPAAGIAYLELGQEHARPVGFGKL